MLFLLTLEMAGKAGDEVDGAGQGLHLLHLLPTTGLPTLPWLPSLAFSGACLADLLRDLEPKRQSRPIELDPEPHPETRSLSLAPYP